MHLKWHFGSDGVSAWGLRVGRLVDPFFATNFVSLFAENRVLNKTNHAMSLDNAAIDVYAPLGLVQA